MKKICWSLIFIMGCVPFFMVGKTPPQVIKSQMLFFQVEGNFISVWNEVISVLKEEGQVDFLDERKKIIKATLEGRNIKVILKEPVEEVVYIYIKAFKEDKPDLPFAEKLANKLIREIDSN